MLVRAELRHIANLVNVGGVMAAFLLILAVLCGVVLVDGVIENTTSAGFTLFGQTLTGLSAGGVMLMAAALGAIITCLLLLSVAASSRRRARRKELRSSQHDLEDRIAELERENATLRSTPTTRTGQTDIVLDEPIPARSGPATGPHEPPLAPTGPGSPPATGEHPADRAEPSRPRRLNDGP
jgi:uncharacterized integral membrane protein